MSRYDGRTMSFEDVIADVDNRLEALENVTELEALRVEIDELRLDQQETRRVLREFLSEVATNPFHAATLALMAFAEE